MGKMKMGFVSDIVCGLTIERMDTTTLDGATRFIMTNGAVITVEAKEDYEGLGTNVSVDADWDYED